MSVVNLAGSHFFSYLSDKYGRKKIMRPDIVISRGKIVAEHGKNLAELHRIPFPEKMLKTVHIPKLKPSDFVIQRESVSNESVRMLEIQENGLVSREGEADLPYGSEILFDPESDILKLVFIESVSGRGEKFIGFVKNWGQKKGAIATSLCWDSAGIIAIGADDSDCHRLHHQRLFRILQDN